MSCGIEEYTMIGHALWIIGSLSFGLIGFGLWKNFLDKEDSKNGKEKIKA